MPLAPELTDGDFSQLQETEGRLPQYPFLEDPISLDRYHREYTRPAQIARDSYIPTLPNRTAQSNLWNQSEADATWVKTNLTSSGSARANPQDGALTALEFYESVTNAGHNRNRSYTFTSEAWHCASAFAEYLGREWIQLNLNDGTQDFTGWFNLLTGTNSLYRPLIGGAVRNGNFATAGAGGADVFANWTEATSGTSASDQDTAVFPPGATASCKLTIDAGGDAATLYQSIFVEGQRYRCAYWAIASTGAPTIQWRDIVNAVTINSQALAGTWTQYSFDFTAPSSFVGFRGIIASTVMQIALVEITPILQPPLISETLRNGGFETPGSGGADTFAVWTEFVVGTGTTTRDTVVFDRGSASCRLNVTTGGDTAGILVALAQIGRRYRISVSARNGGAGILSFQYGQSTQSNQVLTTTWTTYTYDFTATGLNFALATQTAGAVVYIDTVTITPLDEPVLSTWQRPGTAAWRCIMAFYPRAAAGTANINLSSDGGTLSYAGDITKGLVNWGNQLRLGTTPGPYVATLGSARTINAPDYDPDDIFAWQMGESKTSSPGADVLDLTRTYASIPATRYLPGRKWIDRPVMDNVFSGSNWAVSSPTSPNCSLVFTTRKTISGAPGFVSALINSYNVVGHGLSVGDYYFMWAGDVIVDRGQVTQVPDVDHFYAPNINLQVANPSTVNVSHLAAACYENGSKEADIEEVTEFYALGISLKVASGGTILADTDIPLQTVQMAPKNWLAAIAAGSTWAIESTQGKPPYMGPILGSKYTRALMAQALVTQTP